MAVFVLHFLLKFDVKNSLFRPVSPLLEDRSVIATRRQRRKIIGFKRIR